jgi:hypothetical protein
MKIKQLEFKRGDEILIELLIFALSQGFFWYIIISLSKCNLSAPILIQICITLLFIYCIGLEMVFRAVEKINCN